MTSMTSCVIEAKKVVRISEIEQVLAPEVITALDNSTFVILDWGNNTFQAFHEDGTVHGTWSMSDMKVLPLLIERRQLLVRLLPNDAEAIMEAIYDVAVPVSPASDETSGAEQTIAKGEKEAMTTTNNTSTTKEKERVGNMIKLTAADIKTFEGASAMLAADNKAKYGMPSPLFSQFLGGKASSLLVFKVERKFVVKYEDGTRRSIFFSAEQAKHIIDFLMVILPVRFSAFKEQPVFKTLEKFNLKGYLTAKANVTQHQMRDALIKAAINVMDVYVVKVHKEMREIEIDGEIEQEEVTVKSEVLGLVKDFTAEDLLEQVMLEEEVNGKKKYSQRDDVQFYVAKDVRLNNIKSVHSLYQNQSGSLADFRLAKHKRIKPQVLNMITEYQKNGMAMRIEEPKNVYVLDQICAFDGSSSVAGGEELSTAVIAAIFNETFVVHKEDGVLSLGEDVSGMAPFSYSAYAKSMSQARTNGAVGYKSEEDKIDYMLATGQDERMYAKTYYVDDKDEHGIVKRDEKGNPILIDTTYKVMNVGKAYKRFMLGGSNGKQATKGLLSTFNKKPKVEYIPAGTQGVIGEIKPEYIVLTNTDGEKITIAIVDDFHAFVPAEAGLNFLLNILNADKSLSKIQKFDFWTNAEAREAILKRNLTDGQGWHNARITQALRTAGVINSFDSFQLRMSSAVKGASFEFNPICELLGADIVLTHGMIKSEGKPKGKTIAKDFEKRGFQLFVVGQRKDGEDGAWIASQATQQMGMNLDVLKKAIIDSISFAKDVVNNKIASDVLAVFDAANEETEGEFKAFDFVRLAKEFDIMDEQYLKDEVVSLAVKKLNKLLDSKLYARNARTRYMFTEPFAIYNAMKSGRYEVVKEDRTLGAYEVVTPAKKEDGFVQLTGKAASVRYPITVSPEIPLVTAVAHPAFAPFVESGLWQGVVFFDAFTFVVAQQAGADHDGDSCTIIFDPLFVQSVENLQAKKFGGLEVLPFIDAYVVVNENGNAIEFGTGCPEYGVKEKNEDEIAELVERNGFTVSGNEIIFKPSEFEGPNGEKRRREFLSVVAKMSRQITLDTIEGSLIGVIANYAMILTDLLTRDVLSTADRLRIEEDLLVLCTAGRWEIDRPKHGGAYLEMPVIEKLFSNFQARFFDEEEMGMSNDEKREVLKREKGVYRHIFDELTHKGKIVGFKVNKPQWLASQKDEDGISNQDSTYQLAYAFAEEQLKAFCHELEAKHGNTAKNNIRGLVLKNAELTSVANFNAIQARVAHLYATYSENENVRSKAEKKFKAEATQKLEESKAFGRNKNVAAMTQAKKNAVIRRVHGKQMDAFKSARELYKAQLRKSMYELAKEVQVDVRALVGMLYLGINDMKTNSTAKVKRDGREYRLVATNGFIALPFEVFAEEMKALISGKVSEVIFTPQDLTFTLLQTSKVEAVTAAPIAVRVTNPAVTQKFAGKTKELNESLRIAVRTELVKGAMHQVMYILNKGVQVNDVTAVKPADASFVGFAPAGLPDGVHPLQAKQIEVAPCGTKALVLF